MKKILVKAYLVKNFGDDLFLKVLFDKYRHINWTIDTTNSQYENMFYNYENVHIIKSFIYKILKKIRFEKIFYKKYNAVVFIGGSIFMQLDFWEDQYEGYKKDIVKVFNNKTKFILGSNFGPFTEKKFLEAYRQLFSKCTDVCFREEHSFKLFKDLNNVRMAPDIVFQLKPKNIKKIENSIGISLIDLKNRKNLDVYINKYNSKIKELVEFFINNGKKITFFSFCEFEGDLEAINNIINIIDNKYKKHINIESYDGNMEEFLIKFESMENIIGTRFHSCILSQVFGQGLYPLIYSDKTYNVLKDIGLDNEYTYIKEVDKLDPKHVFDIINNNKIYNKNMFIEAEKQFEGLDKYIYE